MAEPCRLRHWVSVTELVPNLCQPTSKDRSNTTLPDCVSARNGCWIEFMCQCPSFVVVVFFKEKSHWISRFYCHCDWLTETVCVDWCFSSADCVVSQKLSSEFACNCDYQSMIICVSLCFPAFIAGSHKSPEWRRTDIDIDTWLTPND